MKKILVTFLMVVLTVVILFAQAKQSVSKATMESGKAVYESTCQACHQANGEGVPQLNPPLVKTQHVLGDKSRLINIVLRGMDETVQIDGVTYSNAMPALPYLTDQQVADVLTYVRNSFGNKASAVTVAQVKAERAKIK